MYCYRCIVAGFISGNVVTVCSKLLFSFMILDFLYNIYHLCKNSLPYVMRCKLVTNFFAYILYDFIVAFDAERI